MRFSGPSFHAAKRAFSPLKLAPPSRQPPEALLDILAEFKASLLRFWDFSAGASFPLKVLWWRQLVSVVPVFLCTESLSGKLSCKGWPGCIQNPSESTIIRAKSLSERSFAGSAVFHVQVRFSLLPKKDKHFLLPGLIAIGLQRLQIARFESQGQIAVKAILFFSLKIGFQPLAIRFASNSNSKRVVIRIARTETSKCKHLCGVIWRLGRQSWSYPSSFSFILHDCWKKEKRERWPIQANPSPMANKLLRTTRNHRK